MRFANLLRTMWSRATRNDGLLFRAEFENVYKAMGGVGAMVFNPVCRITPSAQWPLLPGRYPTGIIHRNYDSSNPNMSGWPDLVDAYRDHKIVFETATGEQEGVLIQSITVLNATSIHCYFLNTVENRGFGAYLDAAHSENLRAVSQSGLFSLPSFTVGGTTISAREWVHLNYSETLGRLSLQTNTAMPISSGEVIFGSGNEITLDYYPRRIIGQADQARHYSTRGLALHEASQSHLFMAGLVRRDYFQGWRALVRADNNNWLGSYRVSEITIRPTIVDENVSSTATARTGDSRYGLKQGFFPAGHGTPRVGDHTNSPALGGYYYIIGGRKLDA